MTRFSYLSHLQCSTTGRRFCAEDVCGLSHVGSPLIVRYDLNALAQNCNADLWRTRHRSDIWKYHELLPVRDESNITSFGEYKTPLLQLDMAKAGRADCVNRVFIKDDSGLPTHSFKARGISVALSRAKELRISKCIIPSAGNAGVAAAAYARRAGIEMTVVCPRDVGRSIINALTALDARYFLVDGLIAECGMQAHMIAEEQDLFNIATLEEPYRIEGKKSIAFELAEQFEWRPPSVIFYPTGGGTGLIAIQKAFEELKALGWVKGAGPRLVAVQSASCAPIVKAWREGRQNAETWSNGKTCAHGLRVPAPFGDRLILNALKESNGFAIDVTDHEIFGARKELSLDQGIFCSLEGAATYAAMKRALDTSQISSAENVVCFNSASWLLSADCSD